MALEFLDLERALMAQDRRVCALAVRNVHHRRTFT